MKKFLGFVAVLTLLVGCSTPAPTPDPQEPDPEPEPPAPLVVTIADYYAIDGTRTLVLDGLISNRETSLSVVANCFLNSPPSISAARYAGTIRVETQGSVRYLPMSGTVASPGASSISCNSIQGTAPDGETAAIRLR